MKLFEAWFSWEVDRETGDAHITFPSLSEARSRAVELLQQEMQERIDNSKKYEQELGDTDNLSVAISVVEVVPITAKSLCQIINSSGGSYSLSEREILKIELPAGSKRVHVTRLGKAKQVGTQ